ncbi:MULTISPECIES: PEP-CTERM sorting domain-containing protein [unclassified Hahella]|uniref:PEP-CTERM sorting domain-containing protein n=1 Tax=unclassified Hahella TaxID=2624107 RepID=UPI001C1EA939|nr:MULTISPECIES: PEP-CTERM sorting domain-containing protein [unclassified Hahella]MBU6955405.1 hypothetical protein [Hahella sp. HN01]MDG9669472.1 hypothetical protein [Hahella sp. CR1]
MNPFRGAVLATTLSAVSMGVSASTLVFDFSGSVDLTFDPNYHSQQTIDEYTDIFMEDASYATFLGQIILPNFDNYLTGTHQVSLNSNGLNLAIVSGMLGGIEGTRQEAPDGVTWTPDSTQDGDSGVLTIVDGNITSFQWYAGPANEGIIGAYNSSVFDGWKTKLGEINLNLNGATDSILIGDVYFASNQFGAAAVTMVPEADAYAMWMAGLGIVGYVARRRSQKA